MADMFAGAPVTLQDMLGAARRELGKRRAAYPRWVAHGKMTQDEADREIRVMAAIVEHFEKELAGG